MTHELFVVRDESALSDDNSGPVVKALIGTRGVGNQLACGTNVFQLEDFAGYQLEWC